MVRLSFAVDLVHGGRWTSLRSGGREWLWRRPAERESVRPGDAFVDAGGLEECLPTVRGTPDHGHVWSRPWRAPGCVEGPGFALRRSVEEVEGAVVASYALTAAPGFRFLWAAHALLDLSPSARIVAPPGTATRVFPDAGPWRSGPWPAPLGTPLDACGPDDGTATGAILTDCPQVTVEDGGSLTFSLAAEGQPVSVALWRNLGGWPAGDPYRSIGVEPMLGRAFDLAEAGDGDAAVVPASGVLRWRLTVTATG
ncbi:hypothetical protein RB614_40065 [Phytohabitans sp. ZYX-F-186]|uniref:Aldose 1-epimerase n=1 Tax=Phytohabitans maris TaxID=3071409 RepID=A0ABU0ZUJ0_9ACTN|nr:hypothetical protein [Phytohabitans sp. ZYX-F-186]MDQ7910711.1 hypothetical protein [Phytohabitans sp. ZYX-F-186]